MLKIIRLNDALLKEFKFDLNDHYVVYRLSRLGMGLEQSVTVSVPLALEKMEAFKDCMRFVAENRHKNWTP